MTQGQLRLRLVVRRNGLPETKVVFPVSFEAQPTVAKLLEQVNDVLPLESDDWGLEDYAVELQSADGSKYECLHFQPLKSVFKDDDQVFIRPLLTDDLRRRRISGRDQVSNHGKHLFDGVPFGRPLLKAPKSRPRLKIPPRKRPRLLYYPSEDTEEGADDLSDREEDAPRLLLTQGEQQYGNHKRVRLDASDSFINADTELDERDGRDPDYEAEDEDMTTLSDEIAEDDDEDDVGEVEDIDQELQDLRDDQVEFDGLEALHAAFPTAPKDACKRIWEASEGDLGRSYKTLLQGFKPTMPESALVRMSREPVFTTPTARLTRPRRTSSNQRLPDTTSITNNEHGEDQEASSNQDDEVTDFQRQFDKRGLPPGSISLEKSGKGLKAMAELMSKLPPGNINGGGIAALATSTASQGALGHSNNGDDTDTTSSSGTSSESEDQADDGEDSNEESDSSNDDSSSESSDDDAAHPGASGSAGVNHHSDHSDSDESSDSDTESGPEETSARGNVKGHASNQSRPVHTADTTSSDPSSSSSEDSDSDSDDTSSSEESSEDEDSDVESHEHLESRKVLKTQDQHPANGEPIGVSRLPPSAQPAQPTVPPGAGTVATKKRNARRRAAKKAKTLAERGDSPDLHQPITPDAVSTPTTIAKEEFEAKRRALLEAIANGGVEVGPDSQLNIDDESMLSQQSTKRKRGDASTPQVNGQQAKNTPVAEHDDTLTSSAKRRRIDLGAGRRMLFGALGLRNPKTKDDEDKLRAKLMRGVKPLANVRIEEEAAKERDPEPQPTDLDRPEATADNSDAWREKIIYRAVECCQEGVELSEPPFPFVQRWDPQQQNGWYNKQNKRGGRGKRAERNQAHFYQESGRHGKKRKQGESQEYEEDYYDDSHYGMEEDTTVDDIVLNYDDEEASQNGRHNDIGTAEHGEGEDDLPLLPDDLIQLPPFHIAKAEKGMVITWTKMVMSRATKWQPQMCNFTGEIIEFVGIDDDAAIIEVVLAKRDRHLDWNEKQYDEVTGERILEGFEVDDPDEDPEEERKKSGGYRTLNLAEMGSPRILQEATPADKPDEVTAVAAVEMHVKEPTTDVTAVANDAELQGSGYDASLTRQHVEMDGTDPSTAKATPSATPSVQNHRQLTSQSNSAATSTGQPEPELPYAQALIDHASQVSSPSRQLHNETMRSIDSTLNQNSDLAEGPESVPSANEFSNDRVAAAEASDHRGVPTSIASGPQTKITGPTEALYPKLEVPQIPLSSAGSVDSGRQPDYSMDMDIDAPDSLPVTTDDGELNAQMDSLEPVPDSTDERAHTPKPVQTGSIAGGLPVKVIPKGERQNATTPSSLDSLNTVWCTAATSGNTHSPSSSQAVSALKSQVSQVSAMARDAEYEKAMRKLDDQSDDDLRDVSQIPASFETDAKGNPQSQLSLSVAPSNDVGDVDDDAGTHGATKISPPPMSQDKLQSAFTDSASVDRKQPLVRSVEPKRSSQVSLPPGTQVVEISSDESDDAVFTENYADDDVDEDYDPNSSRLPKGPRRPMKNKSGRSSTAPSGSQSKSKKPRRISSSAREPPRYLKSESAAAVYNRLKQRLRKSSGSLDL